MKDRIVQNLNEAIAQLQKDGTWPAFEVPAVAVERPKDLAHGDWTTNVAMVLAKELKKAPLDIAKELAGELESQKIDGVSQIDVASPGYVNITLEREHYVRNIETILKLKDDYGSNDTLAGKKVMVEYTDPNPFKVFHIGHLMPNAIGESIARLIAFSGAEVKRANYQGDVGLHVAKTLWALTEGKQPVPADDAPLSEKTAALGAAYACGSKAYDDDEAAQKVITAINKKIYEKSDDALNTLYEKGRQWSLDHFEEIYATLGTTFDFYFFESEVWQRGKEVVEENVGTVFEKSDGAIVFKGEDKGLHTRVFVNAEGLPTYEAKDIGLALAKCDAYAMDHSITVTAVEQKEYFAVVFSALGELYAETKDIFTHIPHGLLQLTDGKMSSRTGNVISGEELLTETITRAQKKIDDNKIDAPEGLASDVGVAAIKFAILKQSLGKNVTYDPEQALSFEGDSGPYLQYTAVRCASILEKAHAENLAPDAAGQHDDTTAELERMLERFGEVVARASTERAPHHIATYCIELAQLFNTYYAKNIIVDKDESTAQYRLSVAGAVKQTLTNGLTLLGIKTPERM